MFLRRVIGQRWKNIDPDRLAKYSELASEDTERYKTEMQAYNGRQEAKMRSEALKPAVTYGGPSGMPDSRLHQAYPPGPAGPGGPDPSRGYDQMGGMSAFGNPGMPPPGYGPYGGMEYGGYPGGMGMGYGMGAYGGYGMGPPQDMRGGVEPGSYGGGPPGGYGMAPPPMGGFQGGMMGYG